MDKQNVTLVCDVLHLDEKGVLRAGLLLKSQHFSSTLIDLIISNPGEHGHVQGRVILFVGVELLLEQRLFLQHLSFPCVGLRLHALFLGKLRSSFLDVKGGRWLLAQI